MFHKPYENNDRDKKKKGHEITRVSALFLKYSKLLKAPQGTVVQAFLEVVQDMYGIVVRKEQCSYQVHSKTLAVSVSGPLKSEILLNKQKILSEIGKRIGADNAPKNIL